MGLKEHQIESGARMSEKCGCFSVSWMLWIPLYGAAFVLSGWMEAHFDCFKMLQPIAMLIYTSLLMVWYNQRGRRGMRLPRLSERTARMHILPLAVLPAMNLLCANQISAGPASVIILLCAAACEEIFFRGFLLRWLATRNVRRAILISSGVFSLFHLVNLVQARPALILWQVVYAFAAGLAYGAYTIQQGSLVPCIVSHALTNLTAGAPPTESTAAAICCSVSIIVCTGYAWMSVLSPRKYNRRSRYESLH